jgi:hypothetical protein
LEELFFAERCATRVIGQKKISRTIIIFITKWIIYFIKKAIREELGSTQQLPGRLRMLKFLPEKGL